MGHDSDDPTHAIGTDDFLDFACSCIQDSLMGQFEDGRNLGQEDINRIRELMHEIDPTESHHAAHVRDCIRDNSEFTWW